MNLDLFQLGEPPRPEDAPGHDVMEEPETAPGERYVVVDTETTGLYPDRGDRLLEVAAVRIREGKAADSFSRLIHPGCRIPPGISRLNGITDPMVAGERPAREVLPAFLAFLKQDTIVAHNAPFDLGFLAAELGRAGLPVLANATLDTRLLARALWPDLESYGLDRLAARAGIATPARHRALADAEITAAVFLVLQGAARSRGVSTREGLEALCREGAGPEADARVTALLQESAAACRAIFIRYATRPGWRQITPRRLDARYLLAYCHDIGKDLTFRLDRILEARELPET